MALYFDWVVCFCCKDISLSECQLIFLNVIPIACQKNKVFSIAKYSVLAQNICFGGLEFVNELARHHLFLRSNSE